MSELSDRILLQASQLAIRYHSFTALAIQSTFSSIPQIGVARQFTTELCHRSPVGYPSHYRSLPRLIQSAPFQVGQNLEFFCLHTLLFLWEKLPVIDAFSATQNIVIQSINT